MKSNKSAVISRNVFSSTFKKQRKAKARIKKKVPMHKLLRASLKYQGKIFFSESTLHGVRYIAETKRPIFERLIWFVCVMVGAISTMVIIVSLWEKFQTNPTITGLDTDFHNWDIPFPAVTICPNMPWNEEKLQEYVNKIVQENSYNETTAENFKAFIKSLTVLTYPTVNSTLALNKFEGIIANKNLRELTYQLMSTCEDLLPECKWKTNSYNCCSGFFPVYTETGFCYSFNSRHYESTSPIGEPYPEFQIEFIKETDIKWSLKFFIYNRNTTGYNISIYLHNSDEIPGIDMKPQHVLDFNVERLLFSMRETYTTENAHQLSVKQRHCIFDDEVKLRIDKIYTYTACTQQCRMDTAQRLCQCIPHFYKIVNQTYYKHCTLTGLKCISGKLDEINYVENCHCELGCSNTIYEVDKLGEKKIDSEDFEEGQTDLESFECEFTSWPMIKYKREVLFGWVDLLVSFGGIAGLFLGFSLLSGVEIIYYFTIRACCMVYKQRDELTEMVLNPEKKDKNDYDLSLVPYFVKEPKTGHGREIIRRRFKDNLNFKITPILVKPINPNNKIMLPPFGFDYTN